MPDSLPQSTEAQQLLCDESTEGSRQAFHYSVDPYARPPCLPAVLICASYLHPAGGQTQSGWCSVVCGAGRMKERKRLCAHTQSQPRPGRALCSSDVVPSQHLLWQTYQHVQTVLPVFVMGVVLRRRSGWICRAGWLAGWPPLATSRSCQDAAEMAKQPIHFQASSFSRSTIKDPARRCQHDEGGVRRAGRPIRVCCATHHHAPRRRWPVSTKLSTPGCMVQL